MLPCRPNSSLFGISLPISFSYTPCRPSTLPHGHRSSSWFILTHLKGEILIQALCLWRIGFSSPLNAALCRLPSCLTIIILEAIIFIISRTGFVRLLATLRIHYSINISPHNSFGCFPFIFLPSRSENQIHGLCNPGKYSTAELYGKSTPVIISSWYSISTSCCLGDS